MSAAPQGLLVVLSGPSGVGKTTVVDGLLARPGFGRAVTATTRAPREGEVDGRDYHFLDAATFARWVAEDRFLEHATVHGRSYGTPRTSVDAVLAAGNVCLLNIDVQGAALLRADGVDALFVFLTAPDGPTLRARLTGRGSDDPDEIERRLATARAEMARAPEFDAVVINDDLDRAIGEIVGLVNARRASS